MEWSAKDISWRVPIKCWASNLEASAMEQAVNLAKMPCIFHHVALAPDCHTGYAIPIGGIVAYKNAVSPYGCGNDAGCGMRAVQTNVNASVFDDMMVRRDFQERLKKRIPVGTSVHRDQQPWEGFEKYLDEGGLEEFCSDRIRKALGTLGDGNHFIELQKSDTHFSDASSYGIETTPGNVWLMAHSGSRSLGGSLAKHYHDIAKALCKRWFVELPSEDYAFLPIDDQNGIDYIRDMNFALDYALENRRRMMNCMVETIQEMFPDAVRGFEYDIHHNFARLESHFGENVWVHRKGSTSARLGEIGIIPGSMGTHSYIVKGLGNEDSFSSCSHGAGRRMSRTVACQTLTVEQCDDAMKGIVCERWGKVSRGKAQGLYDLSEAPGAYKDIEEVINNERDLVEPIVQLSPLACLKG